MGSLKISKQGLRCRLDRPFVLLALVLVAAMGLALTQDTSPAGERLWLAGDSHIHSHWSPGYDRTQNPPEPIKGVDAAYPTPTNARKAREYGLSWMVTTDHGGPNHSKYNLVHAYAELKQSRTEVPDLLQFYGMELNMPAMDHHTLILPHADDEWKTLFNIESQFDSNEAWPVDPSRNTEAAGFRALMFMNGLQRLPLLFANHPSRSATGIGAYDLDEPREFRNNIDTAPNLYRGMEGAPGHQASALAPDGSIKRDPSGQPTGSRGAYRNPGAGTLGGFDQMTAIVGGLWDSMLGEGRHFWIVATSDSHLNYADTPKAGSDFWPGQYQKTYVYAHKTFDDVLEGLREGRVFAVAGDLVNELNVSASAGRSSAETGGTLTARSGSDVQVTIRFRDPVKPNASGDNPTVKRIDLIVGDVRGPLANRNHDKNETTKVVGRFRESDWKVKGDMYTVTTTIPRLERSIYLRVRGTSTAEAEPTMDPPGENPWFDLWFYSNPIFVRVK